MLLATVHDFFPCCPLLIGCSHGTGSKVVGRLRLLVLGQPRSHISRAGHHTILPPPRRRRARRRERRREGERVRVRVVETKW
jgi:hypothetical protein